MGYMHIDNLYKNQTILMFKECYALEKIHGTSAHISWKAETKTVSFFSGGEKYENFVSLFDQEALLVAFSEIFVTSDVVVFGEAYGGKQQGMRATYGDTLKFIVFDVKVGEQWVNVPNAFGISQKLGLEFVDFKKVSTDLESLNFERDRCSEQAIRNGCGEGKLREGVVLRPLFEFRQPNGDRVMAKHKRDEFKETKTPREVNPEELAKLTEATAIAEEWVTEMRLKHVLDKMPPETNIEHTRDVIRAMEEDVLREAEGEIVESPESLKAIRSHAAIMFKKYLQSQN